MNILISELIRANGAPIGGDYRIDQDDSMTTSPTTPPTTTDDFIKNSRQGPNRFMYRSFAREDDNTKEKAKLPSKDRKKKYPKKPKSELEESAKFKMDDLVEDIINKKSFDKDIIDKIRYSQINTEGIPDLDVIKETNPILVRKVVALKDIIEKNNASGEEKGIILNYLLSLDMTDLPPVFKNKLKEKIV
jgi:hypothetical protein